MQKWDDLSRWAQASIVLILVWIVSAPFLIGLLKITGEGVSLFVGAPFILLFIVIGVLTCVSWVLRRIGL